MKYLRYIFEDPNIQKTLLESSSKIENISLNSFIQELETYIYDNLVLFIEGDKTFINIKKYVVDQTVNHLHELTEGLLHTTELSLVGAGAVYATDTFRDTKKDVESLWEKTTHPIKGLFFDIDDKTKADVSAVLNNAPDKVFNTVEPHVNKVLDSVSNTTDKIGDLAQAHTSRIVNKITTSNPESPGNIEPQHFINTPLVTLAALATIYYAGSTLLAQYSSISRIAGLRKQINSHFNRLNSIGISEANQYMMLNSQKYEEAINKCSDKSSVFGVFEINLSCPLDAYLTYCSSMIIAMALIYMKRVNKSKVDNMKVLLATKDEFAINQMLLNDYNTFCFSVDYIYKELPGLASKWKSLIDTSIEKFSTTIPTQPKSTPQPQTQGFQNRPGVSPYVRQNNPGYKQYSPNNS